MTMVGYARVSSEDQDLDLQLAALRDAGCKKIFREKVSGAKEDRSQLKALREYIREGDTVVVYKLDRLARSMSQLIALLEEFKAKGIGFKTLTGQQIDTTSPNGTFIFHIFAAMAEFERGLIRERSRAGMDAARAAGTHMGRPPLDADVVADIRRRFLAGESWRQISREAGVSLTTIARYLDELEKTDEAVRQRRQEKPANGRKHRKADAEQRDI